MYSSPQSFRMAAEKLHNSSGIPKEFAKFATFDIWVVIFVLFTVVAYCTGIFTGYYTWVARRKPVSRKPDGSEPAESSYGWQKIKI